MSEAALGLLHARQPLRALDRLTQVELVDVCGVELNVLRLARPCASLAGVGFELGAVEAVRLRLNLLLGALPSRPVKSVTEKGLAPLLTVASALPFGASARPRGFGA